LRPTLGLLHDNSRPSLLTSRGFLSGIVVAALTARLSAEENPGASFQRHRASRRRYLPLAWAIKLSAFPASATSLTPFRSCQRWEHTSHRQRQSHGSCPTASRGVRVLTLLKTGYLSGSILVAGAIALTDPIGSVGLIVPHLMRSKISPDNRVLLPSVFLFGGTLLATCDAVGRIVLPPAEIPAGAVLALIGGTYLVWAIRQRRPSEEM
jgi:hypothetical protein